jgi:hypothetical protein
MKSAIGTTQNSCAHYITLVFRCLCNIFRGGYTRIDPALSVGITGHWSNLYIETKIGYTHPHNRIKELSLGVTEKDLICRRALELLYSPPHPRSPWDPPKIYRPTIVTRCWHFKALVPHVLTFKTLYFASTVYVFFIWFCSLNKKRLFRNIALIVMKMQCAFCEEQTGCVNTI